MLNSRRPLPSLLVTVALLVQVHTTTARAAGATRTNKCSYVLQDENPPKPAILSISNSSQKVYAESRILNPDKPTFIFLPGLYQGLGKGSEVYQPLINSDMNWVLLNFSVHPKSIVDAGSTVPKQLSLLDLAKETKDVIANLKIRQPVIVTLSFSSALGQYFTSNSDSLVIETGPIGRYNEELGAAGFLAESWAKSVRMLPGGASLLHTMQEASYRSYWSKIVMGLGLEDSRLTRPQYISTVTSGYVKLSQAIEGYDIREVVWHDRSTRYFMLGELESAERLQNQKQGILHYWKSTGIRPFVVLAENGEHNVSETNPEGYLAFLKLITTHNLKPEVAGAYLKRNDLLVPWSEAQLRQFLEAQ